MIKLIQFYKFITFQSYSLGLLSVYKVLLITCSRSYNLILISIFHVEFVGNMRIVFNQFPTDRFKRGLRQIHTQIISCQKQASQRGSIVLYYSRNTVQTYLRTFCIYIIGNYTYLLATLYSPTNLLHSLQNKVAEFQTF